jgi:hypothetical protein
MKFRRQPFFGFPTKLAYCCKTQTSETDQSGCRAGSLADLEQRTFDVCSSLNSGHLETWLATFRPRVGVASNNWLFYVTGGFALGVTSDPDRLIPL